MKTIIIFLSFVLYLNLVSCDTTEPPPNGDKPTLELKLEDVSCIEAWIKLTTTNLQLPATITLKQFNPNSDTVTQNIILSNADSLLYIDSLLPNNSYQYQVYSIENPATSNELSVTTMDTTIWNCNMGWTELGAKENLSQYKYTCNAKGYSCNKPE